MKEEERERTASRSSSFWMFIEHTVFLSASSSSVWSLALLYVCVNETVWVFPTQSSLTFAQPDHLEVSVQL